MNSLISASSWIVPTFSWSAGEMLQAPVLPSKPNQDLGMDKYAIKNGEVLAHMCNHMYFQESSQSGLFKSDEKINYWLFPVTFTSDPTTFLKKTPEVFQCIEIRSSWNAWREFLQIVENGSYSPSFKGISVVRSSISSNFIQNIIHFFLLIIGKMFRHFVEQILTNTQCYVQNWQSTFV